MQDVILRFLTCQVITTHPAVYWGLALVWMLLVLSALASIRSLEIGLLAKVVWIFLVLSLPLLGLALYALRCLFRGNWSFLKPLLASPKAARQIASR